jgi:hypothetical protein
MGDRSLVKTVQLDWHGTEYECKVTMGLINRIEEDVNLMKLAARINDADPPLSQVATVFSHLLRAAGCEDRATAAEVWDGMFGGDESQNAAELITACTLALQCVFPDVKLKTRATAKKKPTRTRKKATPGRRSTR